MLGSVLQLIPLACILLGCFRVKAQRMVTTSLLNKFRLSNYIWQLTPSSLQQRIAKMTHFCVSKPKSINVLGEYF